MNAESYKIGDLAARFGAQLQGDATTLVTGVASITAAREGDLVFASDEAKFRQAMESRATAIVTGRFANTTRRDKPFLISDSPKLLFSRIAEQICREPAVEGRDESAQVHVSAQVGEQTFIGAGAVIEEGASIGDFTKIGANSVIGKNVHIGTHCRIDPNVTIYAAARLGDRVI
ncbi:MAG TPA: LpxD N-terminal domain-containing protein, partial [Candidatus Sulfotelmatobacter sp.]|nr:LpxD N-terminal domain-containing protein [Candidatus Sulfotelmatobacter sp.]